MSNYSTGELAKLCNITTRTIQYYDCKGILRPQGFTGGKRRVYIEQRQQTSELVLLLKDLGCTSSDIDMLLKGEGTLKTLNTLLTMKRQEISQQVKQQQTVLDKIKNVQYYVNETSTSPVTHLKDMGYAMSKSTEMKSIHRSIWISAGVIGVIQYSSILSSVLMKNRWSFLIALLFMIGYGIGITIHYQRKVVYLCPNCQHIFSSFSWVVIKAKHTVTARRFECPNYHETHYYTEVPKTYVGTEQLDMSHIQHDN